jgi:hypothetical protein
MAMKEIEWPRIWFSFNGRVHALGTGESDSVFKTLVNDHTKSV